MYIYILIFLVTVFFLFLSSFYLVKIHYADIEVSWLNYLIIMGAFYIVILCLGIFLIAYITKKRYQSLLRKLHQERNLKNRYHFYEWITGGLFLDSDHWKQEIKDLGFIKSASVFSAFIIEIDQYHQFGSVYTKKNQCIFKKSITTILEQQFDQEAIVLWSEWTSFKQLSAVITSRDKTFPLHKVLVEYIRKINVDFPFTVTIGLSRTAKEYDNVHFCYHEATQAIEYKGGKGNNRLIVFDDCMLKRQDKIFNFFETLRVIGYCFRNMDSKWRTIYLEFFNELKTELLPQSDLYYLFNYLISCLDQEINSLAPEYKKLWNGHTKPKLMKLLDTTETITDIKDASYCLLNELQEKFEEQDEQNSYHTLIYAIRAYIENNYNDSNLSLTLISEHFGIKAKYLSKLFKKEFGIKYVDFLIDLRIIAAKELLTNTNMSLQIIAEKVGYSSAISFSRTFKKVVGISPGEYREDPIKTDLSKPS
ncbi:AraC family transcriptional regulator [Evansella sp. AB-P1]|uniref:helix-turn-helix transcriptional regulator n=1 Tax=Evansella sp. AB-P1 TaxID=3037653 RepID=UPI00241DB254|nr:AraC family transcriptional regulator [Evansella sp. AB-P1]MDG5790100.1 AraC family transcriptional regulator [Evansella sp. AB-P1]